MHWTSAAAGTIGRRRSSAAGGGPCPECGRGPAEKVGGGEGLREELDRGLLEPLGAERDRDVRGDRRSVDAGMPIVNDAVADGDPCDRTAGDVGRADRSVLRLRRVD